MNSYILQQQFAQIGARLEVKTALPNDQRFISLGRRSPAPPNYLLDITRAEEGEQFSLTLRPEATKELEFLAVDIRPEQRHLLLLMKPIVSGRDKEKFLCGHDERHWFVAPVPRAQHIANVSQAMEALKPTEAIRSQWRQQVRDKDWNKRHNAGFLRQGEWFFVPLPNFTPPNNLYILTNEPIQRSGGKAHWVQFLYRIGGTKVYVSRKYPRGLSEAQYKKVIANDPAAEKMRWDIMQRDPQVYAKGKVSHPDHATLHLPFWHQVFMSGENRSANIVFLD